MVTITESNLVRVQRILREHKDLSFIVGNGINRFESTDPNASSWETLVSSLWSMLSNKPLPDARLHGISLTELYDLILLSAADDADIIDKVLEFVKGIPQTKYHSDLQRFFMRFGRPVLTTNFDPLLESGLKKRRIKEKAGFTHHYPWNVYYSDHELSDPLDGFGVWHINGSAEYRRSMKLGLDQYMNMAARVKSFLHSGEMSDYAGRSKSLWRGATTWLHIIFNSDLFIFGLGLDVNETLLRWLLIERAKYFENHTERRKLGWYITKKESTPGPESAGKYYFLEAMGFEVIELDSYEDIYRGMLGIKKVL